MHTPDEPPAQAEIQVVNKRTWVDGRPAAYSVAGEGVPVLFLHGWALNHHTYRGVVAAIAGQHARVVAPALPGFGGTAELPRSSFTIEGYASWVSAFLQALELDQPHVVVGHSFGGGVAIRYAHRHADRTRSLVLVNSVGGSAWQKGSTLTSISQRPLWDWGLHFPADIFPVRQATRVLPVIAEGLVPNLVRNPRAIVRVAGLARRADLRQQVEDLRDAGMPITILWGTRDGVIPRESFEALCVAAGVEGHVVEGSHSWLLADPDQFGEVITNNLDVARLAHQLDERAAAKTAKRAARRTPARLRTLTGRGA